MLIRRFVLKVINNEIKILTRYEITDPIAEQIVSVITEVRKETNLWIHPNLRRLSFSFTYSFKFTYFCIVDKWILEKEFCNNSQPLKLQENIKMCHKFT